MDEAGDGQEALKVWEEQNRQIDLLMSDMVMPGGMTGLEVAERLRESKPGLKVIISSGYSSDLVAQGGALAKRMVRLQKPFEIGVLSKTIRDCLDRG